MNDQIYNEISDFMEDYKWYLNKEMTRETRIEEDFGITGDEAVEFLIKFGKHFNVDVSHFMADEYFEPEGKMILFNFQRMKNKKVLTVGDLEKAIKLGYLI